MKPDKPVLLCIWNYYRTDHTVYLLELAQHFQLIFLNDYEPSEKTGCLRGNIRLFWNNFSSPYEILDKFKISKILFYDIESFHQTALVLAARNRKIKTYVLEHGHRGGFEIDLAKERYYQNKKYKSSAYDVGKDDLTFSKGKSVKTLLFYMNAVRFKNILTIHWILLYIYYRKKYGLTYGLSKIKNKFRWADVYFNYSIKNASYIQVRDGVPLERFEFAGNPAFDPFLNKVKTFQPIITKPYMLLLDSPFVESEPFKMKIEVKNNFIQKLNKIAMLKGCLLRIKLHPVSYQSDFYFKHENIIYHSNDDIYDLIINSNACVHIHLSTLFPLAILYKPYIFFNTYPEFNPYIEEINLPYFDFYNFNEADVEIKPLDEKYKEKIIDDFLFNLDGNAFERIRVGLMT